MLRITRCVDFAASLRYRRADLSDAENRCLFGRAAHRHGHNYRLEVTLHGSADPRTGMLFDLKELKEVLAREVEARFDHRDLNDDTPFFEKTVPTPENFALLLYRLLAEALPPGLLYGVRLQQDEDTWVDVQDDGEGAP